MFFSEDKISEIIEKNDIVSVIADYMNLRRSGSNYTSLCPFHSEKTPSFSVSQSKQIFHCFGCGVGGNVVTFIQRIERVNYVEALKLLAERAGVELENNKDEKELERLNLKKSLYKVNREAARFFYGNLSGNNHNNKEAVEYLKKRGLSEAVIKKFGLGFANNSWTELYEHLTKKGFDVELLSIAGLISHNDEKNRYYDKFRNRIMYPIIDLNGNIIAFGGRVMDDSKPKYLNSPDTPVFNKGYNIYALNYVKKKQELENIIIVEGYMDVIALHQYGVDNAVASLGTAFTENQAKLLKRFSNDIIIAYDSDIAGQAATMKGLSILEKEGCNVRVLRVPSGKDPDEYIRKEGVEAFRERIKKSITLIEYKIENAKKGLDMDNMQDRIRFTKELSMILKDVESDVETDAYVKKYSKITQIGEEAIYSELNRLRGKYKTGNTKHNILNSGKNIRELKKSDLNAERFLLNACIYNNNKAKNIFDMLKPDDFSDALNSRLAEMIYLKIKEGKTATAGELISHFEDEEEKSCLIELFSDEASDIDNDSLINFSIEKVKQAKIDKSIQELTERMNHLFETGEKEKANELFIEIVKLQRMKK